LQCGRISSSEIRDIAKVRDDFSRRAIVDKKPNMDWDPIRSSVRKKSYWNCYGFSGVNSSSDRFSSVKSKKRDLLEGIDGVARSS